MEEMGFRVEMRPDGAVIVRMSGRLTNDCKPVIMGIIKTLLDLKLIRIVISLNDVSYLSSDALGAFISALRYTKDVQGKLAFAEIPEQPMKLFHMTMLHKVLDIHDHIDSAVESFN